MTKDRKYTLDQMLGPRPAAWKVAMATVGLLAVAVATLMPILNVLITYGAAGTWWKYLFAAGAVLFLARASAGSTASSRGARFSSAWRRFSCFTTVPLAATAGPSLLQVVSCWCSLRLLFRAPCAASYVATRARLNDILYEGNFDRIWQDGPCHRAVSAREGPRGGLHHRCRRRKQIRFPGIRHLRCSDRIHPA